MASNIRPLEVIRISSIAIAVVLMGALPACDNTPTRPTPTPGDIFSPIRLEIQGPRSVPPGQSAQFSAIAFAQDGSTRDMSASATWQSSQGQILTVQGGLVTARAVGDANISVALNRLRSTKEVIVVPAGTYRLLGSVGEADDVNAPVVGARVEVTGGQITGLQATTTGADGRYRLYGVAGDSTLRVSKDGYQTHTQNLAVTDHTQSPPVGLTLLRPRLDVSGTYTLTVSADPSCSGGLPEEVRTRTYSAVLAQVGPQVEVRLAGATFALSRGGGGDHFTGRVEPGQLVFALRQYDAYYYGYYGDVYYGDIVEQLTEKSYLAIWGNVAATGTSRSFSGAMDGAFELYSLDPRSRTYQNPAARCRSGANRFQLSR